MRISREAKLMAQAELESQRSTCSRNHVGALIVLDGRILMSGYNGAPSGMPHCDHRCTCGFPGDLGRPMHSHILRCPAADGCRQAVHAEANAIAYAARHGVAVAGAEIYTTLSPCYDCCKLIINAGLRRVVFNREYRDTSGLDLLAAASVDTWRIV